MNVTFLIVVLLRKLTAGSESNSSLYGISAVFTPHEGKAKHNTRKIVSMVAKSNDQLKVVRKQAYLKYPFCGQAEEKKACPKPDMCVLAMHFAYRRVRGNCTKKIKAVL